MNLLKWKSKITIGILALFVFFLATSTHLHAKEACDEALFKCGVDALIALVLSGPHIFVIYSSGCYIGYTWCLKYYE